MFSSRRRMNVLNTAKELLLVLEDNLVFTLQVLEDSDLNRLAIRKPIGCAVTCIVLGWRGLCICSIHQRLSNTDLKPLLPQGTAADK